MSYGSGDDAGVIITTSSKIRTTKSFLDSKLMKYEGEKQKHLKDNGTQW